MFKKNVGNTDKTIRLIVAVVLIGLYIANVIPGIWGIVLLVIGLIQGFVGISGSCPLYTLFGKNTCNVAKK